MRKFSILILVAVLTTLVSFNSTSSLISSATAQYKAKDYVKQNNGVQERLEAEMITKLKLKKRKKVQFIAANEKFKNEMKTAIRNNKGNKAAMAKAMKEMKDRKDLEMKRILSKKQYANYINIKNERQIAREKMSKGKRGGMRGKMNKEGMQDRKQDLFEKLNLTQDQTTKVEEIRNRYKAQKMALKNSISDKESAKNRIDILKMKKDAELKSVLTAQQFTMFQQLKDDKEKNSTRGNGTRGNMGKGRPIGQNNISADVVNRLNLTNAQRPQFNTMLAKYQSKLRDVMKATAGDKMKTRTEIQNVLTERDLNIKSILDAKQYALFKSLMNTNLKPNDRRPRG